MYGIWRTEGKVACLCFVYIITENVDERTFYHRLITTFYASRTITDDGVVEGCLKARDLIWISVILAPPRRRSPENLQLFLSQRLFTNASAHLRSTLYRNPECIHGLHVQDSCASGSYRTVSVSQHCYLTSRSAARLPQLTCLHRYVSAYFLVYSTTTHYPPHTRFKMIYIDHHIL
jgi:hypothetical protein